MKKIISLIIILVTFTSCTTDVKFNNPGFQAYRDGILFRALDIKAYKSTSTGAISFVATAQDEQLNLNIESGNLGTYYLGTSNTSINATYSSTFNSVSLLYKTNIIFGPVAKMYPYVNSGGSGYVSDWTMVNGVNVCSNSHPTTNSGSGIGLRLCVTTNASGAVTSVKVASPGNGYKAGDIITIVGGDGNAEIIVLNVEGSNGEINITENTGDTVSGNFKFNAINSNGNPLGGELINFQYGTIYKVPLIAVP
jgi:hypothetical protein